MVIDTSLLLALSTQAKHVIFLKDMAMPAAADVVLFSCRFTHVLVAATTAHAAQVQGENRAGLV